VRPSALRGVAAPILEVSNVYSSHMVFRLGVPPMDVLLVVDHRNGRQGFLFLPRPGRILEISGFKKGRLRPNALQHPRGRSDRGVSA
jgi:hypothetical protein